MNHIALVDVLATAQPRAGEVALDHFAALAHGMLIPNAVAIGPGRASLSPCDRKQPASGFDSATRVFQGSPASAFTMAIFVRR